MIVSAAHPVDLPIIPEFYLPLDLRYIDGFDWLLTKKFTYGSVILKRVIEIPEGFITNFASIPRILWSRLPPTGKYGKAAVVHDWLYRNKGDWTRAQADAVLNEAMTELGVGRFTRWIIYTGVRAGGGSSYKGN